jgi:hypothetical protein
MENLPKFPLWCTPLTLAATFFLAQLGRDAGKRAEPALWQSWDGPPTTRRLRHRNRDLNPVIRARQHEKLSELMHAPLPTLQEEIDDPIRADATYDAAVLFLRENTRAAALVFKENVAYGFRRNLWAMKPAGIFLSTLGTVASVAAIWYRPAVNVDGWLMGAVPVVLNAMLLAWWLLRINSDWVRLAAEAYADRLLATTETLKTGPASHGNRDSLKKPKSTNRRRQRKVRLKLRCR